MRVTQGMLTQQFLYNLTNINQRLDQEQTQSSSGKILNEPSDNPLAVSQDMAIRASLAQTTTYQGVITSGLAWMNSTSSAVQNIITALQSIQTNVNEAATMTSANATEVGGLLGTTQQLVAQIYSNAGSTLDNNNLFSGAQVNYSGTLIAQSTIVTGTNVSGTSVNYYDSPGAGVASDGLVQSVPPQSIAQTLNDPYGLIQSGQDYQLIYTGTISVTGSGSITSNSVIELVATNGYTGTVIASGTVPTSATQGTLVTLTGLTSGTDLTLSLGNIFQTVTSGTSVVTGTFNYSQTDMLLPSSGTSGSSGSSGSISYEISPGVDVPVNLTAAELFHQSPDGSTPDLQTTLTNITTAMSEMSSALNNHDMSAYNTQLSNMQNYIGALQANTNQVINLNADLGVRIQRMQTVQQQLSTYSQTLTNEKSTLEDANMASVLTKYSTDQTVFQSALAIGAKILLPTLLNYLPNG